MASKGWRGAVAAGFFLYRKVDGVVQYLQMKHSYGGGHWTPPKGHVDPEDAGPYETAIRETREEAGLTPDQYEVMPDFKKELRYLVSGREKTVHYWLARVKPDVELSLSEEHVEYKWAPLEEAKELAHWPDAQKALDEVCAYIESHDG